MTLYECARKMGVETHYYHANQLTVDCDTPPPTPRPDLEIAHELLAKLPSGQCAIGWLRDGVWQWCCEPSDLSKDEEGTGTFIEAVIALYERSMR